MTGDRLSRMKNILPDVLVGLPAGFLILMGTLLFNTLLGRLFQGGAWMMLVILCAVALVTGMIARWLRPVHGTGTALAAGVIAASLLLCLRLAGVPGAESSLAFGVPGMLSAIAFPPLGCWLFTKVRKR
jgi:cobalamin synthase